MKLGVDVEVEVDVRSVPLSDEEELPWAGRTSQEQVGTMSCEAERTAVVVALVASDSFWCVRIDSSTDRHVVSFSVGWMRC